jgi:hypothetical protein
MMSGSIVFLVSVELVIGGLIYTDCGYCLHLYCVSTSPSEPDSNMPWYYISRKYQKHVKQQEGRFRHVEKELKAARQQIDELKLRNVGSNVMQQDNWGRGGRQSNSRSSHLNYYRHLTSRQRGRPTETRHLPSDRK